MKNRYVINGEVTTIFIERRDGTKYQTIIDTSFLQTLIDRKLTCYIRVDARYKDNIYVIAKNNNEIHLLHRLIMNETDGKIHIDHINKYRMDNRSCNLRAATPSLNALNRKMNSNNSTGTRNVYWHEQAQIYFISISIDGEKKYFGRFNKDEYEKAEKLANFIRQEIYGIE